MNQLEKKERNYSIRMILCPNCVSIQEQGIDCSICRAPLYLPYLTEDNNILTLQTYQQLNCGENK